VHGVFPTDEYRFLKNDSSDYLQEETEIPKMISIDYSPYWKNR
jgi:hypothetical protein